MINTAIINSDAEQLKSTAATDAANLMSTALRDAESLKIEKGKKDNADAINLMSAAVADAENLKIEKGRKDQMDAETLKSTAVAKAEIFRIEKQKRDKIAADNLKSTAATDAENLKAEKEKKDQKEADNLKSAALTDAEHLKTEKEKKDKIDAEYLKSTARKKAIELKAFAERDARDLLELATTVARQQLKLLLENAMFRAIFSAISDGAIVTDEQGNVLFYNQAAMTIGQKDIPPEHFANYFKFFKPDKETPWPPGEDPLTRAIRGKTTIGELMYLKRPKYGTFISCMAVPLVYGDQDAPVAGGFIMFRTVQTLSDTY